jgi:hypothetical protein
MMFRVVTVWQISAREGRVRYLSVDRIGEVPHGLRGRFDTMREAQAAADRLNAERA